MIRPRKKWVIGLTIALFVLTAIAVLQVVIDLYHRLSPVPEESKFIQYSSVFPFTENPISQGGQWEGGLSAGLDWNDVQTNGSMVYATTVLTKGAANQYADSIAINSGLWNPNITIIGTIVVNNASSNGYYECELLARASVSAHRVSYYEFNLNTQSNNSYWSVVLVNGPLGTFTFIDDNGHLPRAAQTGDTMKFVITGSRIRAYFNDTLLSDKTDSTLTNGSWGFGFYPIDNGSGGPSLTDVGFSKIIVMEGTSSKK